MERRDWAAGISSGRVAVGAAYSGPATALVRELVDLLDYVEYPYELLRANRTALDHARQHRAVLHSASLSLASGRPPDEDVLRSAADIAADIGTPWVGEHLAFISASSPDGIPGEQFDIGYAISPPMNAETVDNVSDALIAAASVLDRPLLLENSPIYVALPGSNMSQGEVVSEICRRTGAYALIDLAHLRITSESHSLDPTEALLEFPIERVVEVHLSGVSSSSGRLWDDHSGTPDEVQYELLRWLLRTAPVAAVTHEYNWAPSYPPDSARREVLRTLDLITEAA